MSDYVLILLIGAVIYVVLVFAIVYFVLKITTKEMVGRLKYLIIKIKKKVINLKNIFVIFLITNSGKF